VAVTLDYDGNELQHGKTIRTTTTRFVAPHGDMMAEVRLYRFPETLLGWDKTPAFQEKISYPTRFETHSQ